MTNMEYEQYIKNQLFPLMNDAQLTAAKNMLAFYDNKAKKEIKYYSNIPENFFIVNLFIQKFYDADKWMQVANIIKNLLNKDFWEYITTTPHRSHSKNILISLIIEYDITLKTTLSQQLLQIDTTIDYASYLLNVCINNYNSELQLSDFMLDCLTMHLKNNITNLSTCKKIGGLVPVYIKTIAYILSILYSPIYFNNQPKLKKQLIDSYIQTIRILYKIFQNVCRIPKPEYFYTKFGRYKDFQEHLSEITGSNVYKNIDILWEMST